jgi:hypothetical protein
MILIIFGMFLRQLSMQPYNRDRSLSPSNVANWKQFPTLIPMVKFSLSFIN